MMGCVILLGVFALSVPSGWQTAAIVGVQLRQQGAVFLSKNFQGFVFAKNIALFDFLPPTKKKTKKQKEINFRLYTISENGPFIFILYSVSLLLVRLFMYLSLIITICATTDGSCFCCIVTNVSLALLEAQYADFTCWYLQDVNYTL